jgi:hypothetical protein
VNCEVDNGATVSSFGTTINVLEGLLEGPCRDEKRTSHPLWYHFQHLYTHGIQQFADAAVLLSRAGHSPGEIDFLEFVEHRVTG